MYLKMIIISRYVLISLKRIGWGLAHEDHCVCINGTDIDLPLGHLSGLTSTAMIREAPASLQPTITASPTAPQPQIATLLLGSTLAVFRAAP